MAHSRASVLASRYIQNPVSQAKIARSASVFATATSTPKPTWRPRLRARRRPWIGKRRVSAVTTGVSAAHSHHSDSERSIVSRQFAGRPVERYVSELLTAKKSASAVQPAVTASHPRARLISFLLQL